MSTTAVAGMSIYPLDTVRRRQMMEAGNGGGVASSGAGFRAMASRVLHETGWKGFYAGAVPNVIRGMGGSIVLVLYDEISALYK